VQKHISVEGDRVAGVSLHSVEWPPSSVPYNWPTCKHCRIFVTWINCNSRWRNKLF